MAVQGFAEWDQEKKFSDIALLLSFRLFPDFY